MAEVVSPSGDLDATTVNPTVDGEVLSKRREAIHLADPFVVDARLRLALVGSSYRLPVSSPSVTSNDFMLSAAMGDVDGVSCVNKFGHNGDVAANTQEDVWDGGGDYPFPTTALITHISQTTDQSDMRGANVNIQGLDANWLLTTQTPALNASDTTTAVELATPLIRCFRAKVEANFVITSSIRVHNSAENVDYAIVDTGNNQTLMAIYTIPSGKTGYMTSYYCDYVPTSTKDPDSIEFKLWASDRLNNYEFQIKNKKGIPSNSSGFQHEFRPY